MDLFIAIEHLKFMIAIIAAAIIVDTTITIIIMKFLRGNWDYSMFLTKDKLEVIS